MSSTTPTHGRGLRKPGRRTALGGLAIVTAAGLALTGPIMGAFAATEGAVKVQTSQTVKANLTNTGEFDNGYVFSQVSVTGNGDVVVKNPTSTQGLRNLDGWGGPSTEDGKAVYDVNVEGTKRFRTVSKFNKDLPVSVDITYRLNGAKISPDDLAGKSGRLRVSYTITNTTAEPTEITFPDGHGQDVTETIDLVTPYVGQLQLVLPDSFTRVASIDNRADQAGDGHGGRLVTWTMVLFEPIGQTVQKFGYTANVEDASIPPAHMQIVPVSPGNHPELRFGQDGFASGAQSGRDVTDAGVQIDDNLLKLQAGAAKLLDGLTQLQEGSATLAAGLTSGADAAIPGSQQLAEGAQAAADGSTKVADGADQVAAGNEELADGLNQLADGAGQLSDGADQLSNGFNDPTTDEDLTDGSQALAAALGLISDGLKQLNNAQTGLPAARAGAVALQNAMNNQIIPAIGTTSSPCPSNPAQRTLLGCMNPIVAGVNQLGTSHSQVPAQAGLPSIQDGLNLVLNGINKNPAAGPGGDPGFRRGLELLRDNFTAALAPGTGAVDRLYGAIVTSVQPGGAPSCLSVCQATAGITIRGVPNEPALPDKSLKAQITEARDTVNQLLAGLGSANDVPTGNPATTTITGGLNGVNGGLTSAITAIVRAGGLLDGVTGIRSGLVQLRGGLTNADANGGTSNPRCNPSVTPPGAGYCGFTEGLAQLVAGLNQAVAGLGQLDAGAAQAAAGAGDLADGISDAGDGAAQLSAGLKQVGEKVPAAVDGADQLAEGSEKVAAGANLLAAGLNDQLAPGAEELAAGLGSLQQAADGAEQLSDGLLQAEDGNQQIVDGSGELSERGSKKLIEAGDETAREFAKEYAIMQALNVKGAENNMPYGTPKGSADNRGAYDITIAPVGSTSGGNNAGRGVVALVVLGAGAFLATMVRARFA